MKQIFVPEYHQFHCIAGACPDSCCTGWEIVLDNESIKRYQQMPGELGMRLQNAMILDEDGDVILQGDTEACPFWNAQHLCEIQAAFGEDALCDTCRKFPRITQDYGDFIEYDLSLSCPVAAELLLSRTPSQLLLQEEELPEITGDSPAYHPEAMCRRNLQRELLFQRLKETGTSALTQLQKCMRLVCQWEKHSVYPTAPPIKENAFLQFLRSCDILTDAWRSLLKQAGAVDVPEPFLIPQQLDFQIRAFSFDFLYRQFLRCVFTSSAVPILQQLLFSVSTVLMLIRRLGIRDVAGWLRIWQLFCKEIESDSDTIEALQDLLQFDAEFSPEALCAYLEQMEEFSRD